MNLIDIQELMDIYENYPLFANDIIFAKETTFSLHDVNRSNCHYWSHSNFHCAVLTFS